MNKTCVILVYAYEIHSPSVLTAGCPDKMEVYSQTPTCGDPLKVMPSDEAFPRQ